MLDLFAKWYESYKSDQGLMIAVGLRPDEEHVPESLALTWFQNRYVKVKRKLTLTNDQLTIYRCMKVDTNWLSELKAGQITRLGSHWTLDKELAPYLCGGYGGQKNKSYIILEATVSYSTLDILSLFQPSYSEDYEEMEILPDSVFLVKVYNGDFSKVLESFNQNFTS